MATLENISTQETYTDVWIWINVNEEKLTAHLTQIWFDKDGAKKIGDQMKAFATGLKPEWAFGKMLGKLGKTPESLGTQFEKKLGEEIMLAQGKLAEQTKLQVIKSKFQTAMGSNVEKAKDI